MAIYVASQDESATQESAQYAKNLANKTVFAVSHTQHPKENIEESKRNLPSWYGFFRWPNGTATLALILTLLAVAEQTKETAKSAKAARDSADIARLNAEEARACLEIQPGGIDVIGEEGDPYWQLHTYIRLQNVGKSSAHIVRCMGDLYCSDSLNTKSVRDYALDISSAVIEPSGTAICGGDGTALVEFNRPIKDVVDAVVQTEIYLIFRGFVEYKTKEITWHRDFWYVWVDDSSDRVRESGFTYPPNAIERMRDGGWGEDPEQNNSEYQLPNPN